jgi:CBS domain-containing protein
MKCSDVMKGNVQCCKPTDGIDEIATTMRDRNIGFVPVCDPGGKVVGTITDRDIALRVVADHRAPNTTRAQDVMTREVISCKPDDDLSTAMQKMSSTQKSRILCIDPGGRLQGVISLGDLAAAEKSAKTTDVLRSVKATGSQAH